MSETNHPGWKPEGFMREQLTLENAAQLLAEMGTKLPTHFESYGAGIFTHPHEIVGCMYGQLLKLSVAADESIYTGELADFRERCWKTLMAIFMGVMSADRLAELPGQKNNTVVVKVDDPDKICGRSKAVAAPAKVKPGPVRDDHGNVVRISTQKGDPGYDPMIHENKNLKIFCDGEHILTAHTADTHLGIVWFYEKTPRGRIETKTVRGKVEIQGL